MTRLLPAVAAVLAVLAAGLVHGFWTDRWALAKEIGTPAARLSDVSMVLGDWQGEPLDQVPRQPEPIAGYLYRRYVNTRTGAVVTVALVCGRPGPVSIHTPELCYAGSGYSVGPRGRVSPKLGDGVPAAEFFTAPLTKKAAASQTRLRIFWSWSPDGSWLVADNPRLTFARHSFLSKLYLIHELSGTTDVPEEDPCVELMRLLLPELQRTVYAPS